MKASVVPPAMAVVLGLALSGCAGTTPPPPTPARTPVSALPVAGTGLPRDEGAPPGDASTPVVPASPGATPRRAVPVTIGEPRRAPEITRIDAYELCMRAVSADGSTTADPRDEYAGVDRSEVTAVDGLWRVWIPGVAHPDGEPVDVALTCVLGGTVDSPVLHSYGGVASDYFPDHDAYFEELLEPHSD